ncbi:GYPB isoform 1 [Pan troglodytes]|uniref:Glycophorin B (MNS blood group) n=2 Tax=Homininae TaxID=207598 RepID=D6RA87_HUMAN|nr:GYPB isoform 1 [Pan troglodytes]
MYGKIIFVLLLSGNFEHSAEGPSWLPLRRSPSTSTPLHLGAIPLI